MSKSNEGLSPQQRAFAEAVETYIEPDQASIALAMHQRMQPIAESVEDSLSITPIREQHPILYQMLVVEGKNLVQKPEDVVATPTVYVRQAARFMHRVITTAPGATADVFAGYTPIETEGRWSDQFHDASLTDKWENMIVAALQMEEEGQPRPTTFDELAQGAYERGLYRF